jgi:hypothetical protein
MVSSSSQRWVYLVLPFLISEVPKELWTSPLIENFRIVIHVHRRAVFIESFDVRATLPFSTL